MLNESLESNQRGTSMKIIFSRKGFDSGSGGVASPILPDGRLISLPIPAEEDPHSYKSVSINGVAIGPLVEDLTNGKIEQSRQCHLDPDLDAGSFIRHSDWRPAFGQIDAAQSHLALNKVSVGDLFLFFGWFRAVEQQRGRWRYIRDAPDLHVVYGWMKIGKILHLADRINLATQLEPYQEHPHLHGRDRPSNTLYVASDMMQLHDQIFDGGGLFRHISDSRILTKREQRQRSIWQVPSWLHPKHGSRLSYHENQERWTLTKDICVLESVARGQEFVLSLRNSCFADTWLHELFTG